MNLGFWKYRALISTPNKIISRISISEVENRQFRPKGFEALVYLNSEKITKVKSNYALYGTADGGGSSVSKSEAVLKAISESLERWAFYETHNSNDYGFHDDCSTSGMAAFTGIGITEARKNATHEAIERARLLFWWNERLSCRPIALPINTEFRAIELYDEAFKEKTVIVFQQEEALTSYGFATALDLDLAIKQARVEQLRNSFVLSRGTPSSELLSMQEKRLVYFSLRGRDEFLSRVETTSKGSKPTPIYTKTVDTEIVGPWSDYAKVWRCLFDTSDLSVNLESENLFLF